MKLTLDTRKLAYSDREDNDVKELMLCSGDGDVGMCLASMS